MAFRTVARLFLTVLAIPCAALVSPASAQSGGLAQYMESERLSVAGIGSPQSFGLSMDVEGDLMVVGAPRTSPNPHTGSVFVFAFDGTSWVQTQELQLPGGYGFLGSFYYGYSVDLDGGRLLVGVRNIGGFVYTRTGNTFVNPEHFVPADFVPHTLGKVALSGTTAAHAKAGDGYYTQGAAYVFERGASAWLEVAKLECPNSPCINAYAQDLDLSGNTLAVGSPAFYGGRGEVHVYERDSSGWQLQQTLHNDPGGFGSADAIFGIRLSLDGETLAVSSDSGVRVYERQGTNWTFKTTLTPPSGAGPTFRGTPRVRGNEILVGRASNESPDGGYLFVRDTTNWRFHARYAARSSSEDLFNYVLGNDWIFGVYGSGTSAALAFERNGYPVTMCNARDGATSTASCACGATGGVDSGCDNSQGTGGVLIAAEFVDPDQQQAALIAEGYPVNGRPTAVVLFSRGSQPAAPFTDGVLCVDTSNGWPAIAITRAENGLSSHQWTHGTGPGLHTYQVWYRSGPGCGAGSNLSNAITIPW